MTEPALQGVHVVEAATLFAAPLAGMFLGDYGAEVIKVEHPVHADPARGHGPSKDGWACGSRRSRVTSAS